MTIPAAPPETAARPASPALEKIPGVLLVGALAGLLVITLTYPGATRMHAWPWSAAAKLALLLPALALLVRAAAGHRPLVLPFPAWLGTSLAAGLIVATSALASPYRPMAWLWSAPLLAGVPAFLLTFDWLHAEPDRIAARRDQLGRAMLVLFALIAAASIGPWLAQLDSISLQRILVSRNLHPLGHPNYTAGLALLMLPSAVAAARSHRGAWRALAVVVAALALGMAFTSGSRGGALGLAAMAGAAWLTAPISRRRKWQLGVAGLLAALAFTLAHPRTRAMLQPTEPGAAPNISNVQREAMLVAGWRMGSDRPLLGWGPGTTPLVYPHYRAGLDGGVENALQLHSLPVQVWAELGGAGLICLVVFAGLLLRAAARDPTAATTLAGYGVFALTDWQLDVPVFSFLVAGFAARLATPATTGSSPRLRVGIGIIVAAGLAGYLFLARQDPTPEMNTRALILAREPAGRTQAVALLRESLALNPHQEIAHFNLGWLEVVSNPIAAELHFRAAAQLVPDKGGVYFGLGLARLNQGRFDDAAAALALECLNDPAFLSSPWWREPPIAALRQRTATEFARLLEFTRNLVPADGWTAKQLAGLYPQIDFVGQVPTGPERTYRRERRGYPVLMRNLDLPTPFDLFDVREVVPDSPSASPLPPKGWLPSPVLLRLLDSPRRLAAVPARPGSLAR